MYVCVYVCMYGYTYIHTYIYVYNSTIHFIYVTWLQQLQSCSLACVCMCMSVCMHVCKYVFIACTACIHMHTQTTGTPLLDSIAPYTHINP